MADDVNNAVNEDEDEDVTGEAVGQFLADLLGGALGGGNILAVAALSEPKPVENGIARYVGPVSEDASRVGVYEVEPPLGNHTHVACVPCTEGCHAYIVPLHADDAWEGGYRPCGGVAGAKVYKEMTYSEGGIAGAFRRFGYTVAEQA